MNEEIHHIKSCDVLDLHNFRPNEAKELIVEFIWSCDQTSIKYGTIIHGKGAGTLQRLTHSILEQSPMVKSFKLGDGSNNGNWGKTVFEIND